jgi:hypothetical protein
MSTSKLVWNENERGAKVAFSISHVGKVTFEVDSELPGSGARQTPKERHALALRHAKLLVRNLASQLERQI